MIRDMSWRAQYEVRNFYCKMIKDDMRLRARYDAACCANRTHQLDGPPRGDILSPLFVISLFMKRQWQRQIQMQKQWEIQINWIENFVLWAYCTYIWQLQSENDKITFVLGKHCWSVFKWCKISKVCLKNIMHSISLDVSVKILRFEMQFDVCMFLFCRKR